MHGWPRASCLEPARKEKRLHVRNITKTCIHNISLVSSEKEADPYILRAYRCIHTAYILPWPKNKNKKLKRGLGSVP